MKNDLSDIAIRVQRLEDAIFGLQHVSPKKTAAPSSFTGPKGGVLLLLSKSFFAKKKTAVEVATKLREQDYHYSNTVVQTTLRRLSTTKGPLIVLTEADAKYYVIRK